MKVAAGPFAELRRYVSREFFETFSLLRERHGWVLRELHELSSIENADVLLFWESYDAVIRHAHRAKRICVMTDDLHGDRYPMAQALALADRVLSTYAPCIADFFPSLHSSHVAWTPHAASSDFLFDVNESPRNVVFVSGAMSAKYPLRRLMLELANRRPDIAQIHEHPGYRTDFDYDTDARIGRGYAESMHGCLAAFTDALQYRYVVAKHFEIPATGALLIADRAMSSQLAQLGFDDGVHYVSASASDLEEVIDRVRDPQNREHIDAIRRRGHALVHQRHTTERRAREIDTACA
ncbi:MAG TPA: glycosyltransferase [Thermoanaerobaculia bacterium]|nr:glycosyltransferase [Thermoanaerobaculia bacterium]